MTLVEPADSGAAAATAATAATLVERQRQIADADAKVAEERRVKQRELQHQRIQKAAEAAKAVAEKRAAIEKTDKKKGEA